MTGLPDGSPTSPPCAVGSLDAEDYLADDGAGHRAVPGRTDGAAAAARGRAGGRQDRGGQGAGRHAVDTPLLRLQCYEGLTAAEALYEWNYPRQLLAIRLAESRGEHAGRGRPVRRRLPAAPAAAGRDRPSRAAAGRAADRRGGPGRRRVRGVPVRAARRGLGDDPRAGHPAGRASGRSRSSPPTGPATCTTRSSGAACTTGSATRPSTGSPRSSAAGCRPPSAPLAEQIAPRRRSGCASSTCTRRPGWPRRSAGPPPWRRSACPLGRGRGRADAGRGAQVRRGPAAARAAGLAAARWRADGWQRRLVWPTSPSWPRGSPPRCGQPGCRSGRSASARFAAAVDPRPAADGPATSTGAGWPRWSPTRPRSRSSTGLRPGLRRLADPAEAGAAGRTRPAARQRTRHRRTCWPRRPGGHAPTSVDAAAGRGTPDAARPTRTAEPDRETAHRCLGRPAERLGGRTSPRSPPTSCCGSSALMRELRLATPLRRSRREPAARRAADRPAHHAAAGPAHRRAPVPAASARRRRSGRGGWSCCATSPGRWSRTPGPCCSWSTARAGGAQRRGVHASPPG